MMVRPDKTLFLRLQPGGIRVAVQSGVLLLSPQSNRFLQLRKAFSEILFSGFSSGRLF